MSQAKKSALTEPSNDLFEHAILPAELLLREFTSSEKGISQGEALLRLEEYGTNEPAKKKKSSLVLELLKKFTSPLVIILLVIVFFSLFFGERISALIVGLMILLSVFIDFTQEYKSNKAVEELNELVKTKVDVMRGGKEEEVDIKHVVPGDVVVLNAGDMIPADCRILNCKDLFVNQSSLTGESFPVEKNAQPIPAKAASMADLSNIAFMGSSVVSGTAQALVLATGQHTEFGKISKSITTNVETGFERGVRQFTMLMIRFIAVLVIGIFLVITVFKGGTFKDALLFSLAVAVGLTPEMLPMLVTLNLSKGAIRMSKKKVIVKHLHSIQNFGAMDVLCTDKTGTLTLDRIILQHHYDLSGKENEEVLNLACLNSQHQTGLKNVMDDAILKHGANKAKVEGYVKVDEIPFDFERKIMSVVLERGKRHIMITKGAPEEVFKRCASFEGGGNKVQKLSAKSLSRLKAEYERLSGQGFRVLAVAYKSVPAKKSVYAKADEKGLVLKGYVAFLDPPKETTKEVLEALETLGIEVKILTGDNELVSKKICEDVCLRIKGVSAGRDIDRLGDHELRELVERTTIFARLTPMQKERVIAALQKNKHVVGYLGDGINDAPSLKAADVGISVNNAVDIAKESASIILLEKSLMALKDGVIEGRRVFGNIIKYIKMGASSNFGNMLSMTGATLFIPFLPMLPIQILLNNFLYDVANVSVPADDVDPEYLERPRPWNISFIKKFMLLIGPLSSIFDFITYAVMWFVFQGYTKTPGAIAAFHTGWFLESLLSQTLVIYIIRTNKIPFIESKPSKFLLFTTLAILTFAFILPYTALALYFGFTPLPPLYFFILSGMIVTYLFIVQVVKTWVVRKYGYQ